MEQARSKTERPERNATDRENKERKGETNGRRLKGGRAKEKKTRLAKRGEKKREGERERESEREEKRYLIFRSAVLRTAKPVPGEHAAGVRRRESIVSARRVFEGEEDIIRIQVIKARARDAFVLVAAEARIAV